MKNERKLRALPSLEKGDNHHNHIKASPLKSNGSSDFSEFELNSKEIDGDFTPFQKPKNWDSVKNNLVSNRSSKKAENNKSEERERKRRKKIENEERRKERIHEQPAFVSFNKTPEGSLGQEYNTNYDVDKEESKEELIAEYSKSEFKNKHPKRVCAEYNKNSERIQRSSKEDMIKTAGGICFDVSIGGFVFEEPVKKRSNKSRKSERNQEFGLTYQEELLKRRQIAFRYGEMVRRRTFGYY